MKADTPAPGGDARSTGSRIAVIEKAVRTLDALVPAGDGLTPTEVAEAIGTNRSTAFRLLNSLEIAGLLSRDASSGRYRLGMKLLQYGSAVRSELTIVKVAEQILPRLRDAARQSTLLAVREGWRARCLYREPGPDVDVLSWTTGELAPLPQSAAPLALLAALSDGEIEQYLTSNEWDDERGGRTPDDIREDVASTRERGWALSRSTMTEGVASLGTVVRDGSGAVACAISVAGLEIHYSGAELDRTAALLVTAADEIRERLR
jgi:DNA-binding IclR family transcriptional regulator